jgi:hypothetical protein
MESDIAGPPSRKLWGIQKRTGLMLHGSGCWHKHHVAISIHRSHQMLGRMDQTIVPVVNGP